MSTCVNCWIFDGADCFIWSFFLFSVGSDCCHPTLRLQFQACRATARAKIFQVQRIISSFDIPEALVRRLLLLEVFWNGTTKNMNGWFPTEKRFGGRGEIPSTFVPDALKWRKGTPNSSFGYCSINKCSGFLPKSWWFSQSTYPLVN